MLRSISHNPSIRSLHLSKQRQKQRQSRHSSSSRQQIHHHLHNTNSTTRLHAGMTILNLSLALNNHSSTPSAAEQQLSLRQGCDAEEDDEEERLLLKGVRHLCERGAISRLPARYVLPPSDRPAPAGQQPRGGCLPVIDLARLRDPARRAAALADLDAACRDYGFFQVLGHGLDGCGMLDVARRFFDLPFGHRARYMSPDIRAPVRYGTSFNQLNDGVLCWRDFLKLVCDNDLRHVLPSWPDAPIDLREVVSAYARSSRRLFRELMEAALEALGVVSGAGAVLADCDAGSQMLMVNCFPACPEPDLTLGMPPHSDYGFLTVLLQDQVNGLEIRHADGWVLVDPIPGALVVNVGDHFEMFSNGRYKSVLHRVRVNSARPRISVASLHSLPPERVIGPAPELLDDEKNPRRYMDTDFATFLDYLSSAEGKHKSFLQTRRLLPPHQLTA